MSARLVVIALAACLMACGTEPPRDGVSDRGFVERLKIEAPAVAGLLDRSRDAPARFDETSSRWRIRAKSLSAELPRAADGSFEVGSASFRARVRWRGATPAVALGDAGTVVYANALPGVDGVVFASGNAIEELIRVARADASLVYDIELPAGGSLHAVSKNLIELRDREGRARLRLRAAAAWDAHGKKIEPRLEIAENAVRLAVDPGTSGPIVIDPAWEATDVLSALREHVTATLLPSGRVLFAGGLAPGTGYLKTAEIYDPTTATFTATGNLQAARVYDTATLLSSGKVLLAGGVGPTGGLHDSAEIYDEQTEKFTSIGKMAAGRSDHTAVLLDSGKVLLVGGNGLTSVLASTELFDPVSGSFSPGPTLGTARYAHTATRLKSGKLLIAGGAAAAGAILSSSEIYDPAAVSFSPGAPMGVARTRHSAVLMPSGNVMLMGGTGISGTLASSENFDPTSGFSPGPPLAGKRSWFAATLLPNGSLLLTGGDDAGVALASAETYDPGSNTFSLTQPMSVQRLHHAATMLPTGKVLVAGGVASTAADLFDPLSAPVGSVSTKAPLSAARKLATATVLPSGKVLIAGGESAGTIKATADLYDPVTDTVTPTGSMSKPRSQHAATLLRSGKVLVSGGLSTSNAVLSDAELFDPAGNGGLGAFTPAGAMSTPREVHRATLLYTGEILITGGVDAGFAYLSSAEIYDPSANAGVGAVVATSAMTAKHSGHTATLLRDGRVLIAAGLTGNLVAEVYDRSTNAFTQVGSLTRARLVHTATLLPSGKVLIAGGVDGSAVVSSTELFDPSTGGFVQTSSMTVPRSQFSATLLPSGRVLMAGGQGATGTLASLELYDPSEGSFVSAGTLAAARSDHVAQLLPDTRVLIAGGAGSGTALASSEVWSDDAVGNPSWRPVLTSAPATITSGQSGALSGSNLLGISSASYGHTQTSDTNYPIAVWLPAAGGWGTVGRITEFSATSANWTPPPTVHSGYGLLFVLTNGIASTARLSSVLPGATSAPCTVNGECALGHCVDGVCCDQPCLSPCQACSAALKGSGQDGVCGVVPAGQDPKNGCAVEPQVTCGTTGSCDGAGACAKYSSGTVCFAASCSGVVLSPAFTCDGSGSCGASQPVNCTPGICKGSGTSAACSTACTTESDCAPSSFCKDGNCVEPQEPGVACTDPSQCLTGYCVDGFCCNSKCDEVCSACSSQKSTAADGICAPVANGTDPDEECETEASSSCGRDGLCNGAFACRLYTNDTECGQSTCENLSDQSHQLTSFCDGAGVCGAPVPISCGNYSCAANGKCNSTCSSDGDCSPLYRCNTLNQCVPRGESICLGDGISESPDGTKQDCGLYRCNPSSGLCRTSCGSIADCRSGYDCGANSRCRERFPSPNPGCACEAVGMNPSYPAPAAWWALGLAALALGTRRGARKNRSVSQRNSRAIIC